MTAADRPAYEEMTRPTGGVQDDGSFAALVDQIWATLQRRRLVIAGLTAAGLVLGAMAAVIAPERYTATSSVLLEDRESGVVDVRVEEGQDLQSPTVDSQVRVLQSRSLAERVVRRLDLIEDPYFNPALRPPGLLAFGRTRTPPAPEAAVVSASARLSHAVTVRRSGLSFVIDIAVTHENPEQAARIANAYAEEFLNAQIDSKRAATAQATTWLRQQVDTLSRELNQQSQAVQAERARSGLGASGTTVADQQIASLSGQLSSARAELAARQARAGAGAAAAGAGAVEVLQSQTITNLRLREADANRQIAELSTRYGPNHPQMQRAQQQLEDIQRQIRDEIGRIASGNQSEVQVAARRVASLEAELARWQGRLASDTRNATQLQQLEGQLDATRRTYENYVTRLQQVTDLDRLVQADARVVATATRPAGPSQPNRPLLIGGGLSLGLLFGLALAAILDGLQRGLRSPTQVEDWAGAPCLVSVPKLAKKVLADMKAAGQLTPADLLVTKRLSLYSEAFRQLRADLVLRDEATGPKVILISSALAGEGKSTASLALARTFALQGARTVLVEGDLRRPSIASNTGLTPRGTLIQVLRGEMPIGSLMLKDPLTDLAVICSQEAGEASLSITSKSFAAFIDLLKPHYDYIIVDTAPVLAVSETLSMAQAADMVLLVVRWASTTGDAARLAAREFASAGVALRGALLNSVDIEVQSRYTRGDAASYYGYYRKYYSGGA